MTVLLLNDTDEDGAHFGCQRVMRTMRQELALRGMPDLPSLKVGTDWKSDARAMAALDAAQVVVINGEGTLHHGKHRGRWLLEAGARVKARGGRVALVNALWQDNPQDWADLAVQFDILCCRDSRSAGALAEQAGCRVDWIGDLSMFPTAPPSLPGVRQGITVSCSVNRKVTERLASLTDRMQAEFLPITTTLKAVSPHLTGMRRAIRKAYAQWFQRRFVSAHPATRFVAGDVAYMQSLAQHRLLVTGRFHAVTMAIASGTPFVAVASNSWKIEALLADIGLDADRVQPLDTITPALFASRNWDFSTEEITRIEAALRQWRIAGHALFDRIAAL